MNFLNTLYFKVLSATAKLNGSGTNIDDIIGDGNTEKIQTLAKNALKVIQVIGFTACAILLGLTAFKLMVSHQNGEEIQKTKNGLKWLIGGAILLGLAGVASVIIEKFALQ